MKPLAVLDKNGRDQTRRGKQTHAEEEEEEEEEEEDEAREYEADNEAEYYDVNT